MVANSLSDHVQGTYTIGDAGLTPHSPARLLFRGIPRKVMVRQLKTQATLPAVLPHGPLQEPATTLDPLAEYFATSDISYANLTKGTVDILQGLTGESTRTRKAR